MSSQQPCKTQQQKYRECLEKYNYQPGSKCSSLHQEYRKCINAQYDRDDKYLHDNYRVVLPPEPCRSMACDIQDCLEKNGYRGEKCKALLQRFNKCVKENTSDPNDGHQNDEC
mmetsp:Transcript_6721/g.25181  ORF Transcript_6721/g.25181 Transcript_6721/m.25181 type:complete len:113 (-) Transcript_6721:112-450(-)